MFIFGLFMTVSPVQFSDAVLNFSKKSWFHTFEISSRLLLGVAFIALAFQHSLSPVLLAVGLLLCFAGVFLIFIGPTRHRNFARKVSKLGKKFRLLGFIAVSCGAAITYAGVQNVFS